MFTVKYCRSKFPQRVFFECRLQMEFLASVYRGLDDVGHREEWISMLLVGLKACSLLREIERGRIVHADAVESGNDMNIYVASTLVGMYAKCGSLVDARGVFEAIPHRNAVAWTALMLGYAENGQGDVGLELFTRMQREGCIPNARTFVAALKSCTCVARREGAVKMACLMKGMAIHRQATQAGSVDIFVATSLIDMYATCGSMVDARKVFDRMPCHNVVAWNALILGYVENGEESLSLELFDLCPAPDARTMVAALKACSCLAAKHESSKAQLLDKGRAIHAEVVKSEWQSDIFVANTLVDMYAKCGSLVDARRVFEAIQRPTVVSWNALMLGYVEDGQVEMTLELFTRMEEPDSTSYIAVLKACGSVGGLEAGRVICAEIFRAGLETSTVMATGIVDFHAKCGSMEAAKHVFDSMFENNIVTWTALLAGHSRQGETKLVFDLFCDMNKQGVKADGITFVAVLTACSHAGLIDRGKECFQTMRSRYGVEPSIEHYHCMVDLLGRGNQLEHALTMVRGMPFKPSSVTWTILLAACRKWNNVEVGKLAFQSLLEIDRKDAASYTLMANIYGSRGLWEEQNKVELMRIEAGAWRRPGKSWWTDPLGNVHTFGVGGRGHPQSGEIQAKLKQLVVEMKDKGYRAQVGSVVSNISESKKEDSLCGHSEKLAIACALINTGPGGVIRIMKNLRVCDDCHLATSMISKIEKRVIVCRDSSRFHVFKEGQCSCGGFW